MRAQPEIKFPYPVVQPDQEERLCGKPGHRDEHQHCGQLEGVSGDRFEINRAITPGLLINIKMLTRNNIGRLGTVPSAAQHRLTLADQRTLHNVIARKN